MKKFYILFFIFLFLSSAICFIQKSFYDKKIQQIDMELTKLKEENKFINELNDKLLNNDNPIDKKGNECQEKAVSTADSLECSNITIEDWEKEIEKYMSLLKQSMNNEQYELIKKNQDLWKIQNKSNDKIITEFVFNHGGTMYYQIASSYYVQELKQRAEFLKNIYETYNDEK